MGGPGSMDGMQELIALLGTTDWPQGGVTAEAELANAVASISGPPAAEPKTRGLQKPGQNGTSEVQEAEPRKKSVDAEIALEPMQDRAELMHGLTAEIAAAAQKAAQDAISSSLQVSMHCPPGMTDQHRMLVTLSRVLCVSREF